MQQAHKLQAELNEIDDDGSPLTQRTACRLRILCALLGDLAVQRTAALRAEHTARPNAAPVAVIHNLASQTFYDEIYSLPTGLTIGTEAYTNRVDLRSAEEPRATKDLAKSTKAIRKNLPAKIDDLWQWLLDLPQNVLLNVLAAARAASLSLSKYHQAGLPLLQGQPPRP